MVHLYQAELKACRKKRDESKADLRRDISKLVSLPFPTADTPMREVLGINALLEAISGPASEIKLHEIKGRPHNLQEAVAHATEVEAVIEANNRKSCQRRWYVRVLGSVEDDLAEDIKNLQADLAKTQKELKEAQKDVGGRRM